MKKDAPSAPAGTKKPDRPHVPVLQALSARGIRFTRSALRLIAGTAATCALVAAWFVAPAQQEVLTFKAQFSGSKTRLYWTTAPGLQVNYFAVERSWNGRSFETVGLVSPQGDDAAFGRYSFIDKDYYSSMVYYRLRVVDDRLGSDIQGNLVGIQLSPDAREFVVRPLADMAGSVYIDVMQLDGQEIIVDAVDGEGQIIANAILHTDRHEYAFEMKPVRDLPDGTYTVSAFFDQQVLKTRVTVKAAAAPTSEAGGTYHPLNFTQR
jgi:hypothetical protein